MCVQHGNWAIFSTKNAPTDTTRIWDNPYTGQIRLNGSAYVTQGLIEVYCNGQWGTICDDGFTSNAADTVCTQLGYNDYTSYDSEI